MAVIPAKSIDILSLSYSDFLRKLKLVVPSASGAAGKLYARVFETGVFDPEAEGLDLKAAELLRSRFSVGLLQVCSRAEEQGEAGLTVKVAFRLADGHEIESVAVPMFGDRHTLCVSSQVGCARACAFCQTGTGGLVRNLSSAEIVSQVLSASLALSIRFRNIVFMGMGEPLDNLENVLKAIEILREQRGLSYSLERITVCTSGNVEGLRKLGGAGLKRLNVSISLNAARDELRNTLMPINRAYPLALLSEALMAYPKRKNFVFGVNYCLIPGLNDGEADIAAIAAFAEKLGRALVNVIPYNPGFSPIGRAPTEQEIALFIETLRMRGVPVRRRLEKGRSLMAACGQLGGKKKTDF